MLDCKRSPLVPLKSHPGATPRRSTNPGLNSLVDGKFLTGYPSQLSRDGKIIRVPLMKGQVSVCQASRNIMGCRVTPNSHQAAWAVSDRPCYAPPFHIANYSVLPSKGLRWRRGAAIGGDMVVIAARRKMCELGSAAGEVVFRYRFDTRPWIKSRPLEHITLTTLPLASKISGLGGLFLVCSQRVPKSPQLRGDRDNFWFHNPHRILTRFSRTGQGLLGLNSEPGSRRLWTMGRTRHI